MMKTIRDLTVFSLFLAFSFAVIPSAFCADEGNPDEQKTGNPTGENVSASQRDTFEQYRVLIDLIDSVSRNYVHTMTREELIQAAIEGVTSKLDPYSYYIANEEQENFHREVTSHFGGVGMAIDGDGEKTKVVVPLVGMPAYNAGIHCGDEILEVDGISLEGKKIDEVLQMLSGEIGSTVTLKIRRVNEKKPLDFEITRELILQETVLGFDRNAEDDSWNYWLDAQNGIAYIHVTEFRDETANEFRKVLTELQKPREGETESPLKGLILDLRFNPGGDFNVAIEMCDFFISDGIIVTAKGKNTVEEVWRAKPEILIPKDVPMVLLLNSFSASASEVFSACLQDH
ncbi:MAG: PDZ domain-containing protein, partial [Thermoguttaceae bacterium]|nr:PDZ domain-containing protein [Thermoguttaceae bacterium]